MNDVLNLSQMRLRCVVIEDIPGDAPIHMQIIDLGRQIYIWISSSGPSLSNLHMAIQSQTCSQPAVATIIPAPALNQSASLAHRIGVP